MQTDTKENGVQRGNLCITAGKKVVGIEVGGIQQQQDDHPTGTVHSTAQAIADQIAKPGGEAQFFQLVRHHQQRGKPNQCVPCAFLALHIFPAQNAA